MNLKKEAVLENIVMAVAGLLAIAIIAWWVPFIFEAFDDFTRLHQRVWPQEGAYDRRRQADR